MLRTLFLIADVEDLASLLAEADPLARDEVCGLDEEDVTPALLGALASLLRRDASAAAPMGHPLHDGADGDVRVHVIDEDFLGALVDRDPASLPVIADAWCATDAAQACGWRDEDAREVLGALRALAEGARAADKRVLLWLEPLDDEP